MDAREERDLLFARLMGLHALVRSGVLVRSGAASRDGQAWQEVVGALVGLGNKKTWIREPSHWVVCEALKALLSSDVEFKDECVKWAVQRLVNDAREKAKGWGPEKVAIVLVLQNHGVVRFLSFLLFLSFSLLTFLLFSHCRRPTGPPFLLLNSPLVPSSPAPPFPPSQLPSRVTLSPPLAPKPAAAADRSRVSTPRRPRRALLLRLPAKPLTSYGPSYATSTSPLRELRSRRRRLPSSRTSGASALTVRSSSSTLALTSTNRFSFFRRPLRLSFSSPQVARLLPHHPLPSYSPRQRARLRPRWLEHPPHLLQPPSRRFCSRWC
jgi:hypothetical protein